MRYWTAAKSSATFFNGEPFPQGYIFEQGQANGDNMVERFIVVWTTDGEIMSLPHSTQDEALQQAEKLLREHGCDLEIALHLNLISPPSSIWFNKKRMRNWCLAGFPAVQI